MTIAELSGRHRQSTIVQGEEGQSLGSKDTLAAAATWLAQCYKRGSADRKALGSNLGRTNTQGL